MKANSYNTSIILELISYLARMPVKWSEKHPVRQYLAVSQLKTPVDTTAETTWEAVPATTPVNTMATVALTTTVSIQAFEKQLMKIDEWKQYENILINVCIKDAEDKITEFKEIPPKNPLSLCSLPPYVSQPLGSSRFIYLWLIVNMESRTVRNELGVLFNLNRLMQRQTQSTHK